VELVARSRPPREAARGRVANGTGDGTGEQRTEPGASHARVLTSCPRRRSVARARARGVTADHGRAASRCEAMDSYLPTAARPRHEKQEKRLRSRVPGNDTELLSKPPVSRALGVERQGGWRRREVGSKRRTPECLQPAPA